MTAADRPVQAGPVLILSALSCGLVVSLCLLLASAHGGSGLISLSAASLVLCCFTGRMTGRPILKIVTQAASILAGIVLVSMMTTDSLFSGGGLAAGAAVVSLLIAATTVRLTVRHSLASQFAAEVTQTEETRELTLTLSLTSESLGERELTVHDEEEVEPTSLEKQLIQRLELLSFPEEDDIEDEFEDEELEVAEDDRVVTAWTRRRQRDEERLEGSISVEFAPAQKQVYVHVPFMPGFQCRPQAFCVCDTDSVYSAEFDILHTYGGRMNVRRRGDASEPAAVDVAISITAPLNLAKAG